MPNEEAGKKAHNISSTTTILYQDIKHDAPPLPLADSTPISTANDVHKGEKRVSHEDERRKRKKDKKRRKQQIEKEVEAIRTAKFGEGNPDTRSRLATKSEQAADNGTVAAASIFSRRQASTQDVLEATELVAAALFARNEKHLVRRYLKQIKFDRNPLHLTQKAASVLEEAYADGANAQAGLSRYSPVPLRRSPDYHNLDYVENASPCHRSCCSLDYDMDGPLTIDEANANLDSQLREVRDLFEYGTNQLREVIEHGVNRARQELDNRATHLLREIDEQGAAAVRTGVLDVGGTNDTQERVINLSLREQPGRHDAEEVSYVSAVELDGGREREERRSVAVLPRVQELKCQHTLKQAKHSTQDQSERFFMLANSPTDNIARDKTVAVQERMSTRTPQRQGGSFQSHIPVFTTSRGRGQLIAVPLHKRATAPIRHEEHRHRLDATEPSLPSATADGANVDQLLSPEMRETLRVD